MISFFSIKKRISKSVNQELPENAVLKKVVLVCKANSLFSSNTVEIDGKEYTEPMEEIKGTEAKQLIELSELMSSKAKFKQVTGTQLICDYDDESPKADFFIYGFNKQDKKDVHHLKV